MIRIAATADLHAGEDSVGTLRDAFADLDDVADLLLIAGDLTRHGSEEEAEVLAGELTPLAVPTFAVLGNHDHHCGREKEITDVMAAAGVTVLEGSSVTVDLPGGLVAVAGTKGFGGGFVGAHASEFGEPLMKEFVRHGRELAEGLERALLDVEAEYRIALLHYSPTEGTLRGEPQAIYPFLGSYLLAEAADRGGADLVLHGHAHVGSRKDHTPGGVPVRNVALPVIQHPYEIFVLGMD